MFRILLMGGAPINKKLEIFQGTGDINTAKRLLFCFAFGRKLCLCPHDDKRRPIAWMSIRRQGAYSLYCALQGERFMVMGQIMVVKRCHQPRRRGVLVHRAASSSCLFIFVAAP